MRLRGLVLIVVCVTGGFTSAQAREDDFKGTLYGQVLTYECATPDLDGLSVKLNWRAPPRSSGWLKLSSFFGGPSWQALQGITPIEPGKVFAASWNSDMYKEVGMTVERNAFRGILFDNYGGRSFEKESYEALKAENSRDNPIIIYYDRDYAEREIHRLTEEETLGFELHGYRPTFNDNGPGKSGSWKDYANIRDYFVTVDEDPEGTPVLRLIAPKGGFIRTDATGEEDIHLPTEGYRPVLEIALSDEWRDAQPRRLNFLAKTMRGLSYGYLSITYQFVSIERQLVENDRQQLVENDKQQRAAGPGPDDRIRVHLYHDRIISKDEVRTGVYRAIEQPVLKARRCGGFMPRTPDGYMNRFEGFPLVPANAITAQIRERAAAARAHHVAQTRRRMAVAMIEEEIAWNFPDAGRLAAIANEYGDIADVRLRLLESEETAPETIRQLYAYYQPNIEVETYRFAQNARTPPDILLELCNTMNDDIVNHATASLDAQNETAARDECRRRNQAAEDAFKEQQATGLGTLFD